MNCSSGIMQKHNILSNILKNVRLRTLDLNVNKGKYFASRPRPIETSLNDDGSKEIQIETPWGYIAGKKWGPDGGRKVLAVHGWQDNAGSFDTLVPLLKKNLEIFAIDLPGHGRSSHFPEGLMNYTGEYINAVHRVVKALSLEKFVYLGHSLGSILGYVYASTFPEYVDQYIAIDNLKPVTVDETKLPKRNRKAIEALLELENKRRSDKDFQGYTKEVAIKRMVQGYAGSITPESAQVLLKRGLKPAPMGDGFVYSRDAKVRIHSLELGATTENLLRYGSNMRCEVLHLKARPGIDYEPMALYLRTVEELKKCASSVSYYEVKGTHHVHLNNPERVAPYINEFIKS